MSNRPWTVSHCHISLISCPTHCAILVDTSMHTFTHSTSRSIFRACLPSPLPRPHFVVPGLCATGLGPARGVHFQQRAKAPPRSSHQGERRRLPSRRETGLFLATLPVFCPLLHALPESPNKCVCHMAKSSPQPTLKPKPLRPPAALTLCARPIPTRAP